MFKNLPVVISGILLITVVQAHAAFISNSELLTQSYANKLENWLGDSYNTDTFNTLWRGSDNGFAASTFHSLANNVVGTITLVRDINGNLFGGYNSGFWSSSPTGFKPNYEGFLFNFTTDRLLTPIPGREQTGIYNNSLYGPIFGHDLVITNNGNLNANSYVWCTGYSDGVTTQNLLGISSGLTHFQISDIEVLSIIEGPAPVPEPVIMILFGFGLAGFAGIAGFKRLFRKN
jgi:hypothetical protein